MPDPEPTADELVDRLAARDPDGAAEPDEGAAAFGACGALDFDFSEDGDEGEDDPDEEFDPEDITHLEALDADDDDPNMDTGELAPFDEDDILDDGDGEVDAYALAEAALEAEEAAKSSGAPSGAADVKTRDAKPSAPSASDANTSSATEATSGPSGVATATARADAPAASATDADATDAGASADATDAGASADGDATPDADADVTPDATEPVNAFAALGLPPKLVEAVIAKGYDKPSPIQTRAVPVLLTGRDLFGQAQTGTGKTAAFGLPLLARMDVSLRKPQALVLTPTRELALQVADTLKGYASCTPGLRVEAVYGGTGYAEQLRALKRGVHVLAGTPGRVMDHIKRGALDLSNLKMLVLDEADEMLRMGFVDDVTWILEQTPETRQTALFSATLPSLVRRIADKSLRDPETITIKGQTATAATIKQRYWVQGGMHKTDALARILEAEEHDGVLVFVRTRAATVEVSEALEAKGLRAAALSGEIAQPLRERTVERFKKGHLDLIVATDVAARGLDVDRVSLVVNYDMPYDAEAYIHRIGRTGRMGRVGHAILFSAARDRRKFHHIEKAAGAPIEPMQLPTVADVNKRRIERFKAKLLKTVSEQDLDFFANLVREFSEETGTDMTVAAAGLARLAQGGRPLLLKEDARPPRSTRFERQDERRGSPRDPRNRKGPRDFKDFKARPTRPVEDGFRRYRVEVGAVHGVKPGQLVGAIAGESGLTGKQIGRIEIHKTHSTVDLPQSMGNDRLSKLQRTRVCSRPIRITALRD